MGCRHRLWPDEPFSLPRPSPKSAEHNKKVFIFLSRTPSSCRQKNSCHLTYHFILFPCFSIKYSPESYLNHVLTPPILTTIWGNSSQLNFTSTPDALSGYSIPEILYKCSPLLGSLFRILPIKFYSSLSNSPSDFLLLNTSHPTFPLSTPSALRRLTRRPTKKPLPNCNSRRTPWDPFSLVLLIF